MIKAKTIQIYLPDGDPKSAKIVNITSQLGKIIYCSRKNLAYLKNRDERNFTGIYFLFGKNEEDKECVYIGEADKFLDRLTVHLQDEEKEWFSSVMFFTTKDNSFDKTLVKYFESFCIEKATEAERYVLDNKKKSNRPNVSEGQEADIETYYEDLKLLIATIGFPVFDKISEGKKLYYFSRKGYKAKGEFTNEGFLVKKGSTISKEFRDSANDSIKKGRQKIIDKKIIMDFEFKQDYMFSSPSMAATIIAGGAENGWVAWKNKEGKTLDEAERKNETAGNI